MPTITIQYQGNADSDMKRMVAKRTGIAPPASNGQVTAYWRGVAANELKAFLQEEATVTAVGAVPDPDVT